MNHKSILIIKHGFSETCDSGISPIVSYGDVFRCTCLLEDFKDCHVTWIGSSQASDLLTGNHLIDSLILADNPSDVPTDVLQPHYQTVINLEKRQDWCDFAAGTSADLHYGFKDSTGDRIDNYGFFPASAQALAAYQNTAEHPIQRALFRMCGREWTGQRYVLGYQPRVTPIYDIGLNHHVGPKWPTKTWPQHHWQALHDELSKNYAVSWQQSLSSIQHYIDWLASCRLVITCDSLGLHLSLALKKKIVALFGPTPVEQVYMYGCGMKLTPACQRPCIPCFESTCDKPDSCMEHITVDMVLEAVDLLFTDKYRTAEPEPLVGFTI